MLAYKIPSRLSQSKHALHQYQTQQIQPDAMLLSVYLTTPTSSAERPIDVILQQMLPRPAWLEAMGEALGRRLGNFRSNMSVYDIVRSQTCVVWNIYFLDCIAILISFSTGDSLSATIQSKCLSRIRSLYHLDLV